MTHITNINHLASNVRYETTFADGSTVQTTLGIGDNPSIEGAVVIIQRSEPADMLVMSTVEFPHVTARVSDAIALAQDDPTPGGPVATTSVDVNMANVDEPGIDIIVNVTALPDGHFQLTLTRDVSTVTMLVEEWNEIVVPSMDRLIAIEQENANSFPPQVSLSE